MNVFDHSETDALFQFSHISHSTQEHLKKVYSSLAICMGLAAGGSYVHVVARLVEVSAMATLTALGLIIWLAVTPPTTLRWKGRELLCSQDLPSS